MTTRALAAPSARRGLLTVTTLAAAFSLSGCALLSPVQTDEPAQTADGIDVDLSSTLGLRDLVIVASQKGQPGRVSAQVVNDTGMPVRLTFGVGTSGSTAEVTVPPHVASNLADADYAVTLPAVPTSPGEMTELHVATPDTGVNVYTVPVVVASGFYARVLPVPAASSSAPATPTPAATASPSPSAS